MFARLLALLLIMAGCQPLFADVTPELQRQIRASTFEVVMKKPTGDQVQYEKPLPLDLLPFIERTDLYRSVGTAFAIGPNRYVTAAHVLIAGIDSQYGPPALRTANGIVHPIANIQKFSAFEDFVEFSLAEPLHVAPLPINRSPRVDDVVLAVGNALGDGVVVRDGLFTSETAEEQDGRWKWIRFSAAASPGNSGGPLLDTSGKIIGVVIAKSPNENLNYALPIANVLDAPSAKARFDQRVLTRLPFADATQTYTLKDEFALPLSWEKFNRAFQALSARHNQQAREALLAAHAATLFPHGSDSEAILYSSGPFSRSPGVVIQQPDGKWVIQQAPLKITDLPGDGKLGVAVEGSAGELTLHRGDEASDDAFYSDSKSFMNTALKALNLRRAVGTDQVRVVSLGAAISDVTTPDTWGRKWQVRVWPVPFLDMYLVAQLLPTPDGYFGLFIYVPSIGLQEAKAQLTLIANQATVTYQGTTRQWQDFLARSALLPDSLKAVKLQSEPVWSLHTPRFDMGVPRELLAIDSHSELLMSMNYSYDGPQVTWGVGAVRWYQDAQEKIYLGLWRALKPPGTVNLETRTRFEDLVAGRSPYDGSPVQATSDAVDLQFGLQAPGTKEGTAASGVAYGVSLRMNGHPTRAQVALARSSALQDIHILEQGTGADVALSSTPAQAIPPNTLLPEQQRLTARMDLLGQDIRGRVFSQDYAQYVVGLRAPGIDITNDLMDYWSVGPSLISNRELWQWFLLHNRLPAKTPHGAAVLAAEAALNTLIGKGGPPNGEWTARSKELMALYIEERKSLAFKTAANGAAIPDYQPRKANCPERADQNSGAERPRLSETPHSLQEYYPPNLMRRQVQGTVILSLKINDSGCATDIAVAASSGDGSFDEAALKWAETASFLPGEKGGKPIAATLPLAVNFQLQ